MRTARVEVFRVNGIFSCGTHCGNVAAKENSGNVDRRPKKTQVLAGTVTPGLGSMYSHKSTTRLVTLRRSLTRPGESAKAPSTRSQWQQQAASQADTEGAASDTAVPAATGSDSESTGPGGRR